LTPLLVAAAIIVLACLYISPFIPDDAYISFRYAENLVHGHELAFNPGEPLEAYSNFFWILISAALYWMGFSLPVVTPPLGLALVLAGLVILWRLSCERTTHPYQLYLPLLAYALAGPLLLFAISGLEMALFTFLLMAMIYAADRIYRGAPERHPWVLLAGCGYVLSLTRPEGVVALPIMLAWMLWDTRREEVPTGFRRAAVISGVAFIIAYAGYTAWRVAYFGDWLPTPFLSKGYDAFPILTAWKKNFTLYFVRGHYLEAPSGYYFVALALLATASVMVASRKDTGRRTDRLALATAVVMSVLYVNFVDWMPQMRYHAPLIGLFCVPLGRLAGLVPARSWSSQRGVVVFVAAILLVGVFSTDRMRSVTFPMTLGRTDCNAPLGIWLGKVLPPGSTIAIGDVGVVPYESGMRTIDIHPESLTDRHIAREGLSVDYLLKVHPDAVMINVRGVYSSRMDQTHYKFAYHPSFTAQYSFIGTTRQRWYDDRSYWVYIDKSIPLTEADLRAFPTGMGTQKRLGFSLPQSGGTP
jgi:hypothetical protein